MIVLCYSSSKCCSKIASQLGFREVGIYFYNIASDSLSEMNKRHGWHCGQYLYWRYISLSVSLLGIVFEFDRLFGQIKGYASKIICLF